MKFPFHLHICRFFKIDYSWLFFLSLLLATRALNFIYFTYWFCVSWKHKEKKLVHKWYRRHFMDSIRFVWFPHIVISDVMVALVVTHIFNTHRATFTNLPMAKAWLSWLKLSCPPPLLRIQRCSSTSRDSSRGIRRTHRFGKALGIPQLPKWQAWLMGRVWRTLER